MIRVHVKQGLLGDGEVRTFELDRSRNLTGRALLDRFSNRLPKSVDVGLAVDGRRLHGRSLDLAIPDGSDVVLGAAPHGPGEIIGLVQYLLVNAAISVAVSYVAQLLSPKPKAPGDDAKRGDDSSSAYSWSGPQTQYGQGLAIPWSYGSIWAPGQVISVSAIGTFIERPGQAPASPELRLLLSLLVSLGEGPFQSISEYDLTRARTSTDLPPSIKVDGVLQQVGMRAVAGEIEQPALQTSGFFSAHLVSGNLPFDRNGGHPTFQFEYSGEDEINRVEFSISFPSGLYAVAPTTTIVLRVRFEAFIADASGTTSLGNFSVEGTEQLGGHVNHPASTAPFASSVSIAIAPKRGPFNVVLQRLETVERDNGNIVNGTNVFADAQWITVNLGRNFVLSYPGLCLALVDVPTKEGDLMPNLHFPCRAKRVRVWDESLGWSGLCFEVPGAPFNWMGRAPGRNPAWAAVDWILSSPGLGEFLGKESVREQDLDLPAFRRWSIQCDQDPNPADPWGEAQFCFDGIGDTTRPAWEALIAICAAGRATPLILGSKISVVYQYRDAHSDALVSVPAKVPVQLLTSSNVEDLQINWMPKSTRPTVIQYQFANEDKDWLLDVLPVEDDEFDVDDPVEAEGDSLRPEAQQAFGIVRPSQLWREGKFTHRVNRLVRRECTFRAGPWTLGITNGDLFEIEHDIMRPFAADVPMSGIAISDAVASTTLDVDHVVTGTGLEVVVRNPNGEPERSAVSGLASLPRGTRLTLAAAVTCEVGAPVVVGKVGKLTEVYQVVSLGLAHEVKREVRAVQWVPEVFDPFDKAAFLGDPVTGAPEQHRFSGPPLAAGLSATQHQDGGEVIGWGDPQGASGVARIWLRDDRLQQWSLQSEVSGSSARLGSLRPGTRYTVAVSLRSTHGVFTRPENSASIQFVAHEWPPQIPPPMRRLRMALTECGAAFRWPEHGGRDLRHYELRAGAHWPTAVPVYRGLLASVVLREPPGVSTFLVARRDASGLFGAPAAISVTPWSPPGTVLIFEFDELPAAAGTHDGTEVDGDGRLLLSADRLDGTYTADQMDAGVLAPYFWQVAHDSIELDHSTIGDHDYPAGSGEAHWRTTDTRPASPTFPGVDPEDRIDDYDFAIEALPATVLVGVDAGELGANTWCRIESRFSADAGDTWSEWAPHRDCVRKANSIQVRTLLTRSGFHLDRGVEQLTVRAFL